MKFSHLAIGQHFEYEGEAYVKTNLFVAKHESKGMRFIGRYAVVQLIHGSLSAPPAVPVPRRKSATRRVQSAFDVFYNQCTEIIEQLAAQRDAEALTQARARLNTERERFLKSLEE